MYSLLKSLSEFDPTLDYVLAIVVRTDGSTYRKAGAMMMINQNLKYWGLLSGGCLEGDIVAHSEKLFATQRDSNLVYNMRDESDLLWGMGLGCDGEVSILLKYLPAQQNHFGVYDGLFKLETGVSQQLQIDLSQNNQIVMKDLSEDSPVENDTLIFNLLKPHHILICGGSPDVPPVTAIAHQIGWKTTVIDHRKDAVLPQRFPFAESVEHVKRSDWDNFDLTRYDSVIIMSHQFEHDLRYLERLLASPLKYIGLLGPTKRRDKLLAECKTQFSEHEGRVFGPIGLDIGTGSPETIALAIISEIQAVRNHKNVVFCYQDPTR